MNHMATRGDWATRYPLSDDTTATTGVFNKFKAKEMVHSDEQRIKMVELQSHEYNKAVSLADRKKVFRGDAAPPTNRLTNPLLVN